MKKQRKIKKPNGIIIDGEVYIAKQTDTPKHRCEKCECEWCDYKLGDRLCCAILQSNEYLILSKGLTNRINDKREQTNKPSKQNGNKD